MTLGEEWCEQGAEDGRQQKEQRSVGRSEHLVQYDMVAMTNRICSRRQGESWNDPRAAEKSKKKTLGGSHSNCMARRGKREGRGNEGGTTVRTEGAMMGREDSIDVGIFRDPDVFAHQACLC